jgi:hypothetical protein
MVQNVANIIGAQKGPTRFLQVWTKKDPSHEDLPLLHLCLGMIMGLGKRDIPRFEDGNKNRA